MSHPFLFQALLPQSLLDLGVHHGRHALVFEFQELLLKHCNCKDLNEFLNSYSSNEYEINIYIIKYEL